MSSNILQRYFMPGLVIQAVVVGGTYATGREITEFFLRSGLFPGFVGLCLTMVLYSVLCMAAFEFARKYRIFDYKSFCEVYMGRFWVLYEFGFLCGVMLTLSVIAAAASEITLNMLGMPKLVTSFVFMGIIAALVFLGSAWLERVMSVWSIFFYSVYIVLLVVIIHKFGDKISQAFVYTPVSGGSIFSAILYTGFSITILPTLMFVARHFQGKKDALIAGSLCGPLLFLPGFTIFFMLSPFYPDIVNTPIPISAVLNSIGMPVLVIVVQVAILGTLAETGAGLLHGINERIDNAMQHKHAHMSKSLRAIMAVAAMLFSIYLGSAVGIIDLVARGFRYGTYYFMAIMILPLLARIIMRFLPVRLSKSELPHRNR